MPEIQKADASIYGSIQAPKGMSLSEMLGIQKSQYELSKLKELYPAMIEKEQALSKTAGIGSQTAEIGLEKDKQINEERKIISAWKSDPRNWQDNNGQIDINKLSVLPKIAPLSGPQHATELMTLANNHTIAEQAKVNMTQNERGIVASTYSALGRAGITDPKVYSNALEGLRKAYPDNKNMHSYIDAAVSNLGLTGKENHSKLPSIAIQSAEQLFTPQQQFEQFAPKVGVQNIGGIDTQVVTQPSVGGKTPTATYTAPSMGGEGGGGGGGGGKINEETVKPIFNEVHKVRPETYPPQISALEQGDFKYGQQLKSDAIGLAKESKYLLTSLDAAEKAIKATSGTAFGQGVRTAKQIFLTNPELETLIKNASDIQARQGAILGAKTDASRETTNATSPNANLSEEGLKRIIDRIRADATNNIKFSSGYNNYIAKKGNVNGQLNGSSYQQAWVDNFDADVFKYMNIHSNSSLSKEEKDKEINKLFTKKDLKEFKEKLHNLTKLEKGENR